MIDGLSKFLLASDFINLIVKIWDNLRKKDIYKNWFPGGVVEV